MRRQRDEGVGLYREVCTLFLVPGCSSLIGFIIIVILGSMVPVSQVMVRINAMHFIQVLIFIRKLVSGKIKPIAYCLMT